MSKPHRKCRNAGCGRKEPLDDRRHCERCRRYEASHGKPWHSGVRSGPAKGDPRLSVAGRKGGTTTMERHGRAHLAAIGKDGGVVTLDRHGHEHFVRCGKLRKLKQGETPPP